MRGVPEHDRIALVSRFLAVEFLLFQVNLAVGELSDVPFFLVATALASALGTVCAFLSLRSWAFFALLVSAPFAVRLGLTLDMAVTESALLTYDRNLLVFLVPFCWAGTTAYLAVRSRNFLRGEPWLNGAALTIFFLAVSSRSLSVYDKPIVLAGAIAVFVFIEFIVLAASASERASGREGAGIALLIAVGCLVTASLLLKPFEEKAVAKGGGLIKPSFLRFDFSRFLRLESEISLSEDLVLIVKKSAEDQHTLIRRYVLSDYDRKKGFQRNEAIDERTHPANLPDRKTELPFDRFKLTTTVRQEYYLVNFDASAFIAMNQPVEIIPYQGWDASSFSSAYAVESYVSEALPFELIDSAETDGREAALRALGSADYATLTDYGGDSRIKEYAEKLVGGQASYWDSVQAVFERLKFGEYRYSLKPGLASDGDQLGRFLFEAKKGYCSYFAFSMTLLLRSLGIPARPAVGFFLDPRSAAFDYFPVRSDMAHAWVEVYFPGYGWIEYDPTTEQLAEGEDFRFSSGVPAEQFEKLLREILSNRARLTEAVPAAPSSGLTATIAKAAGAAAHFIVTRWFLILLIAWMGASFWMRTGLLIRSLLSNSTRRSVELLADHTRRLVELGGMRKQRRESRGEFAVRVDATASFGFVAMEKARAKAAFAGSHSREDVVAAREAFRNFVAEYRKKVPLLRRFLGWMVPFILRIRGNTLSAFALVACLLISGSDISAQTKADDLFSEIESLIEAERWEKAVELLQEGERLYPGDVRYPVTLGDLFSGRKLHGLAWEEYRTAEKIDGSDPALLHRLATTAGRIDKDDLSATYLERVVAFRPDDREAVGDLAWMYFKLHRLREGERFLLDAIDRLGPDPGFSMTLGTIYSDLYDYEASKRWYQDAIDEAKRNGARTFEAVALYNLSILEAKHYRYAEAFLRTGQSLEAADRSSGHLARGELYMKRLDFAKTYVEYERAYELDVSPLSKLNLADAYLAAGRLAEARSYAENALAETDLSWMFNYGTNRVHYKRDVHEILYKTYAGLARLETFRARTDPIDALRGIALSVVYRFRSAGHEALFREYARRASDAYGRAKQVLDEMLNRYDAFFNYSARATVYLTKAREIEKVFVPASASLYELELGKLEKNVRKIETAVDELDPTWQRDLLAEAYGDLAQLYPAKSAEARQAAERLFALNRGALRKEGIRLPLTVRGESLSEREKRVLSRTLERSGFEVLESGIPTRYLLTVGREGTNARCIFSDTLRGTNLVNRTFPLPSLSANDRAYFCRLLSDAVFVSR